MYKALNYAPAPRRAQDHLQRILPSLLSGMPNTYTFSKMLAEILLAEHAKGEEDGSDSLGAAVPLAIVRPTCVGAAFREPIPGWIDRVGAGATLFLASGLGMLSILEGPCRFARPILVFAAAHKVACLPCNSHFISGHELLPCCCAGDPNSIGDQIPVDMVANVILSARPILASCLPRSRLRCISLLL